MLDLCLVVEEISRACGGVGVLYAVNALGSFPILLAGTDEQKKRYLPQVASGEKLIAFGLSERGAGSDAGGLSDLAPRLDGDHYVINGDKKWTTNGGAADLYSVFAVTDPESRSRRISAIIVEKGDPGFEIGRTEDKMGIRCVPGRRVALPTTAACPPIGSSAASPALGLQARHDDARPRPPRRRRAGRRPRAGRARVRDGLRHAAASSSAARSPASR